MKKKRVLVFLSIAAIGTLAYKNARKKRTTATYLSWKLTTVSLKRI